MTQKGAKATALNPNAPEFKPAASPAQPAAAEAVNPAPTANDAATPMEGVTALAAGEQAAAPAPAMVGDKRTVDARSPPPKEANDSHAAKKPSLS